MYYFTDAYKYKLFLKKLYFFAVTFNLLILITIYLASLHFFFL